MASQVVKMRTAISKNAENRACFGFSLIEVLVVLALLALSCAIFASVIRPQAERLTLSRAADTLIRDLKHARLHAEQFGGDVSIEVSHKSYRIRALDLSREWAGQIHLTVDGAGQGAVVVGGGVAPVGTVFRIENASRDFRVIRIEPFTGRIVEGA